MSIAFQTKWNDFGVVLHKAFRLVGKFNTITKINCMYKIHENHTFITITSHDMTFSTNTINPN